MKKTILLIVALLIATFSTSFAGNRLNARKLKLKKCDSTISSTVEAFAQDNEFKKKNVVDYLKIGICFDMLIDDDASPSTQADLNEYFCEEVEKELSKLNVLKLYKYFTMTVLEELNEYYRDLNEAMNR